MLKKLKHGFTLVELVIVIAVIAVLAAVLIPTFITVIDNANNSADLQLVANMNTVMSTNLDENVTATAENLRKYLSDNGLTDITTKKKDNVIVYNKAEKKFKRLNVKNTLSNSEIAYADGGTNFLEQYPYSVEEIFAGNIIVSTGGNEFAEALYELHNNLPFNNGSDKIIAKFGNNKAVMEKIMNVVNTTLYVTLKDDGTPQLLRFGIRSGGIDRWISSTPTEKATRIVFSEDIKEFDLKVLAENEYTGMVFLPQTLEKVTFTEPDPDSPLSKNVMFAGNLSLLDEYTQAPEPDAKPRITADQLMNGQTLSEAKEAVAKLGAKVTQQEFYVVNQGISIEGKEFYYDNLAIAIAEADESYKASQKPRSVVITENATIGLEIVNSGDPRTADIASVKDGKLNLTIPEGITLKIPFYCETDRGVYHTGYVGGTAGATDPAAGKYHAETSIVDDNLKDAPNYAYKDKEYRQVNVTINGDITIKGGLETGGVGSYPDQYYNGHTSGYYGQLNLGTDNTITVVDGGVIDSYGYIKGGNIVAENGADIYEPFIVTDYAGGNNAAHLYGINQSPFLRYAMINIQSNLKVIYGATLWARCNLHAGGIYNYTAQRVIGYDNVSGVNSENQPIGLITIHGENDYIETIYDKNTVLYVAGSGKNNLAGDIGKTTVTIHGSASTESLKFMDMVSTSNVLFPVPFNFNFVIADGGNFTVKNHYVILPGASVTVESGATLTVTENSSFYVTDYLYQGASMSGKTYPTAADLKSNKYEQSGIFTVNGKFIVKNNAKVGGVIRTDGTGATLEIGNADVSGKFSIGGHAAYAVNGSAYECPLRIYDVAINNKELSSDITKEYKIGSDIKGIPTGKNVTYQSTGDNTMLKFQISVTYTVQSPDGKWTAPMPEGKGNRYSDGLIFEMGEVEYIEIPTHGFSQSDGKEATQANEWSNSVANTQNLTFEQLAQLYYDYCDSLSLSAKSKVSVEKFEQLKTDISTKFQAQYLAEFTEAKKTKDNTKITMAAVKAEAAYNAVDERIKAVVEDSMSDITGENGFINTNDRVLFTVENIDESDITIVTKGESGENVTSTAEKLIVNNASAVKDFTTVFNNYTLYVSNRPAFNTPGYQKPVKFTLYSNINLTSALSLQQLTIDEETKYPEVIIDLNGFTLTYNTETASSNIIDVKQGATLKIENGNIVANYSVKSSNTPSCTLLQSSGTLNMSKVNIDCAGCNNNINRPIGVVLNGGTATLTDVNISNCGTAVEIHLKNNSSAKLTNCNFVANRKIPQGNTQRGAIEIIADEEITTVQEPPQVQLENVAATMSSPNPAPNYAGAYSINIAAALYIKNSNKTGLVGIKITNSRFYSSYYGIYAEWLYSGSLTSLEEIQTANMLTLTMSGVTVETDGTEASPTVNNTRGMLLKGSCTANLENCTVIAQNSVLGTATAIETQSYSTKNNVVGGQPAVTFSGEYQKGEDGSYTSGKGNFFAASSKDKVFVGDGFEATLDDTTVTLKDYENYTFYILQQQAE